MKSLRDILRDIRDTEIAEGRKIVFGSGCPEANIMLIGEAPGQKEELLGVPFVGKSGKHLRETVSNVGIESKYLYFSNLVRCRPPENRDPTPEEINIHATLLHWEIQKIDPEILVTLGNHATKYFFAGGDVEKIEEQKGITKLANGDMWQLNSFPFDFGKRDLKIIPNFHPSASLRRGEWREKFVRIFRDIQKSIDSADCLLP